MKTNEFRATRLPEKVLVTGGGGFLGSAIVRRLIDRGDEVRSLARNFYPELEAMGVDQIQGDISDSATVARACEDRTIVYHVAAKPPPWGKYADYHQTNVLGTQNIIDGCQNPDQDKRAAMYARAEVIINSDLPCVYLWVPKDLYGISERVTGWQPGSDGRINLHDACMK